MWIDYLMVSGPPKHFYDTAAETSKVISRKGYRLESARPKSISQQSSPRQHNLSRSSPETTLAISAWGIDPKCLVARPPDPEETPAREWLYPRHVPPLEVVFGGPEIVANRRPQLPEDVYSGGTAPEARDVTSQKERRSPSTPPKSTLPQVFKQFLDQKRNVKLTCVPRLTDTQSAAAPAGAIKSSAAPQTESFQAAFKRVRGDLLYKRIPMFLNRLDTRKLDDADTLFSTGASTTLNSFCSAYREKFSPPEDIETNTIAEHDALYDAHDLAVGCAVNAAIKAYKDATHIDCPESVVDELATMGLNLCFGLRIQMWDLTNPAVTPPRKADVPAPGVAASLSEPNQGHYVHRELIVIPAKRTSGWFSGLLQRFTQPSQSKPRRAIFRVISTVPPQQQISGQNSGFNPDAWVIPAPEELDNARLSEWDIPARGELDDARLGEWDIPDQAELDAGAIADRQKMIDPMTAAPEYEVWKHCAATPGTASQVTYDKKPCSAELEKARRTRPALKLRASGKKVTRL